MRSGGAGGRHFNCKKCGNDHPGVDCQGNLIKCYSCGMMGHRSFECQITKVGSPPSQHRGGRVGQHSGNQSKGRNGNNGNGNKSGGNHNSPGNPSGPQQGRIFVMSQA